jgi:nucleoside-diphosphate-sugar epimerase
MNILLTGSSGFLGSVIEKSLKQFNLFTLNRSSGTYILNLSNTIPVFDERFDLVIHSAGLAHFVPTNQKDSNLFFNNNFLATKNLLSGLESSKLVKKFVFISSVSVYGLQEGILVNEDTPLNAIDPYGKSKVLVEELVINWCKKNGVICTIFRLPLLVGANPPGNLGSMINGIQKGYYCNLSGGAAQKSMVLASDIAKFVLKAADVGGTYNLTDGYHPNFKELSILISKQSNIKFVPNIPFFIAKILAVVGDIIGNKFPINSDKLKKIISTLTFDDSKARKEFGWNPTPILIGFNIHE